MPVGSVDNIIPQRYEISIDPGREDEAARMIVKTLVENGIEVSEICLQSNRLESLFRRAS